MFDRNILDADKEWNIYDEDIMNQNVPFIDDEDDSDDNDDVYQLNESNTNQSDEEVHQYDDEDQSDDEDQNDDEEDYQIEGENEIDNDRQSEDGRQSEEDGYETDDDDLFSRCSQCTLCSCHEQSDAERSYEEDLCYCMNCANENQDGNDTTQSADEQGTSYNEQEQLCPHSDEEVDVSEDAQQNSEQQENQLGGKKIQIHVVTVTQNDAENDGTHYAQQQQYDKQLNSNNEEQMHHNKQHKKHFQKSPPYTSSNGITYYRCLCGCSLIFDENATLFFDMSNKDPSDISECQFHCPCGCDLMFEASTLLSNEKCHLLYQIMVKKQFLGLCVKDDGAECNCRECVGNLDETKETCSE